MFTKRDLAISWKWNVLLITALLLAATTCFADAQNPNIVLKVNGQKEVVRTKGGKKIVELVPMNKIKSGDVLVYTVTYLNNGKSVAKNVTVVDPIPANTVYVLESAAGKDTKILFSINGGTTYLEPPVLYKSRDNAGKEVVQPAPPEMYTNIKWMIPSLNPNATGTTTFKVKVK